MNSIQFRFADPNISNESVPVIPKSKFLLGVRGGTTSPGAAHGFRLAAKSAAFVLSVAIAGMLHAQTTSTLTDIGATAPTPGMNDISQLLTGGGSPPGLNYYFDNSAPPGQTFTTGSDPNGYTLNTLSLATAGGGGGGYENPQSYRLRIYQVFGTNASLIATYISQTDFTFTELDWLQWSVLGAPLQPNTQYAYSFRRVSSGWENMGNVSGNPYPDGQAAVIPTGGGTINYGDTNDYDAAFVVGLNIASSLVAAPPAVTPASAVYVGTVATLHTTAVGPAPLYYQWQTDGGSGGALTNIPSANGSTLAVDTANLGPGFYQYAYVVTNSSSMATSGPVTLIVNPVLVPVAASLSDEGANISSGIYDISQLTGGSAGRYDGLNYYDDNGANHDGWMGQTFTTGTNEQGYYLTSVALQTGSGGSSGTTTLQPYHLYFYLINNNTAMTIAHYTNASFSFNQGDWLKWSGFSPVLQPNTTYAYGFGRDSSGTGWAGLNSSPTNTDLYPGGQISSIPAAGGSVTYGQSDNEDAVFDIGLLAIGVGPSPLPFAQPINVSPSRIVSAGAAVSLIENTTNGTPPLHYQWLTDGGSGTLTNIPSSDVTNLLVDTTGWMPGSYQYQVVVHNTYGSSTSAVATVSVIYQNATATLSDVGTSIGTPVATDISQLTAPAGANSPDGLNYYFDNSEPPGQTFTTGSNPQGYTLTSLAILLAGNSGQLPTAGQTYILRLYTVTGSQAIPYAIYTSQSNFTFGVTDWIRWSGFAVPLAPNSTYAYSLARSPTGSGWDNLANVTGNLYAGGEVATIPAGGGKITFGNSHSYDATFVVGLALPGRPAVAPTIFSPTNEVYAGTPVIASAQVIGTGPFTYQWQSDGGSGGALTDIPGANDATLAIDTTGKDGYNIAYAVAVSNGSGPTTNEATVLAISQAAAPFLVADITPQFGSGFPGGTAIFSAAFDGTRPISYQWQVDKGTGPTNLVGQTSSTLTLSNLQLSDAGTYYLSASNSVGPGSSSGGILTVYPQPTSPFTANFQWRSFQDSNDVGGYTGQGVPGYGSGTFWNQIIGPDNNPGSNVTYVSATGYSDDGSTDEGLSMSVTCNESWAWTSTPVIPLLDSAVTARPRATFGFILPNGLYNLVLFSCNGTESAQADAGAVFNINGITRTALPTQDTSFVEGDNYVVFKNLVVTDGRLSGTVTAVAGKSYGSLNGAQVQFLGPAVTLHAQMIAGGQLRLEWSQGTLLESTNVTGPWTSVQTSSPYTFTPTGPQMFYQVQVQ